MRKQYTIEVRGEYEPQNDRQMRVYMQKLASHAQTLAKMLSISPSTASVALYSDDFFEGHREITGLGEPSAHDRILACRVDELETTVRVANCLKNMDIVTISDLLKHSQHELLQQPNFGRRSLNEVKEILANLGLSLKGGWR